MSSLMYRLRGMMWSLLLAALALTSVPASAEDLKPPPWRGAPRSDFQHWTWDNGPNAVPDFWYNPYGTPTENVAARRYAFWHPAFQNRTGVWELDAGYMEWHIPNHVEPRFPKLVRIQLTLNSPAYRWVNNPAVGPVTNLGGGWYHHFADYVLPSCEPLIVRVRGCFAMDQLVVDALCVPEPGTVLLPTIGFFGVIGAGLRRRRKT